MNCYVFMIAKGEAHLKMAALTKPRAEKLLDTSITLIEPEGDPYFEKLSLFNLVPPHSRVLFIDCDLVLFRWDWSPFNLDKFNAVFDKMHPSWPGTREIIRRMPKHPTTANTGLWFAPATMSSVFEEAKVIYEEQKDFPYRLGDQTPLNVALQKNNIRVHWLPTYFNHQLSPRPTRPDAAPPKHCIGVHLVGSDAEKKLERVETYVKKYPL